MRIVTRRLAAIMSLAVGVGCNTPAPPPQAQWASNLSGPARDTLSRWLFCIDCAPDSDLRLAARALGDRAVPGLGELLAATPAEWRANMAVRYGRMANRIGRSGADSARIVADYLDNLDAATQRRSALLLGDIGTPSADSVLRVAIDSAVARRYRREVVRALHEALLSSTSGPFNGTFSNATPAFLDTVRVRRGTSAWDGDESVIMHGAPFPDDLLTRRWGVDSLAFVAVGHAGRYALAVTNIGSANVTQWDTLHVRRFPAPPWTSPRDVGGPVGLPMTVHQSLSRITNPKDTIHAFRFRPAVDLPVTAVVEWTDSGSVAVTWEDCSDRSFPGTPLRVAGTVVDETGDPLGNSPVTLVGTTSSSLTGSLGQFSLNAPPGWQGTLRVSRIGYTVTDRPAAEGRAGHWVVLRPTGSPPLSPFAPQTSTSASPNSASLVIPGGSCRLLSLTKTDAATPTTIARLRLTSP